jgi:hypothetical protein
MLDIVLPAVQVGLGAIGATVITYLLLPLLGRRRGLSIQVLQTIAMVCEKVVMALEQSDRELTGAEKKMRAEDLVGEILSRLGIQAPRAITDASIEAAVLLMNALTKRRQP